MSQRDYLTALTIQERYDTEEARAEDVARHIKIIRENPGLESIKIIGQNFTTEHCNAIIDALKDCPNLQHVMLWDLKDPAPVSHFARFAGTLPNLTTFEVHNIPVTEIAANVMAKHFRNHAQLNHLNVQHTLMGESGMLTLVDLLTTLPNLACADINDSDGGPASVELAMEEALMHNPNIQLCKPRTIALDQKVLENQARTTELVGGIVDAHGEGKLFGPGLLAEYQLLRPSVAFHHPHMSAHYMTAVDAINEAMDRAPALPEDEKLSREWLTTPDDTGYTPLHFPSTWEAFPRIAAQLEKAGTPLGRAELLSRPAGSTESYLMAALKLGHFENAMQALAHESEHVADSDIISSDGELLPLGHALAASDQIELLFRYENWENATPRDARALHAALPEAARDQVDNLHQLTAALKRTQNRQERS